MFCSLSESSFNLEDDTLHLLNILARNIEVKMVLIMAISYYSILLL